MKKLQRTWMNRVFQKVHRDLEKIRVRHQRGKKVDLSPWGTLENLEWVLVLIEDFLQE